MKNSRVRSLVCGLVALTFSYVANALPGSGKIESVQSNQTALSARPLPPECFGSTTLQLGCKAVVEGRTDDARRYLDEAIAKNGQTPAAMVLRGGLDLALGQNQAAVSDFSTALAMEPHNAEALAGRGVAFVKLNDGTAAAPDLDAALSIKPDLLDARVARASVFYDANEPGKAADNFALAATLAEPFDKHRAVGLFKLAGLIYGQAHREKDAIDCLGAAIRLAPEGAGLYAQRARMERDLGSLDAALADYDRSVELNGADVHIRAERARVLEDMGRTQAALEEFNRLLSVSSEDVKLYLDRANVLMDLGRFVDAQADYEAAAKLKPENARLVHQRMQNEFYLGDYAGAVRDADLWLSTRGKVDSWSDVAYTLLWRHISMQRQGLDDQSYMAKAMSGLGDQSAWPFPLMRYAAGQMDEARLLSEALVAGDVHKSGEQECEAQAYIGERYLSDSQVLPAADRFRRAMVVCPPAFLERIMAMRELQQISTTNRTVDATQNVSQGATSQK